MTLVEICIAVLIVAMAATLVVPAMGNLSRADLRTAANKLAATVRFCYDQAALSGQTFRLTLSPGSHQLRVESTDEALVFDGLGQAVAAAAALPDGLEAFDLGSGDAKAPSPSPQGFVQNLRGLQKLSAAADSGHFSAVRRVELPASIQVLDVWTEEASATQKQLGISLLFFPDGYTQAAIVHLQDREERTISVQVAPLTGRCKVVAGTLEAPR